MRAVDYIFALIIGGLCLNVLVNGKNTAGVINAGGTQLTNIFGTITKSN